MKIYLSKYRNHWLSPYTILEKIFFWREIDYDEPKIDRLANILDPFCQALFKFLEFVHPRINYVKIDKWDTWSMDSTLAQIILPMLKQLRDTSHGSALVDLEDVPVELRGTNTEEYDSQSCFDFYHKDDSVKDMLHKRWEWTLNEMIFAFEHIVDDSWEDKFSSGESDWQSVPCAWDKKGKPTLYEMKEGPNHTYKCDYDGLRKIHDRINNGLRLFGKYYSGLWD